MKSILRKIFGRAQVEKQSGCKADKPLDERFASRFTENGGRFLYCENRQKALTYFQNIRLACNWTHFNCPARDLASWLKTLGLSPQNPRVAEANLMYCECMVASKGSIILSSHQTFGKRLAELSDNYVIVGKVDQIVNSISDGLRLIKSRKSGNIPSNITSITGRDVGQELGENLGVPKNIYLLLVEN